jgi:hypothetical protein
VSHIKDILGGSEGKIADSESERSSDDSDYAVSFHEQDRTSLFENRVDLTERDENDLKRYSQKRLDHLQVL